MKNLSIVLAGIALLAGPAQAVEKPSGDPVQSVVGAPVATPLSGDGLDHRTEEISHEIRCPVCQGSTIGDSPSPTARNMKEQVRDLLSKGYSEDQVLSYFVASYGEFVRLAPRATGFTTLVWIVPVLLFLAGAIVVVVFLRTRRSAPTQSENAAVGAEAPSEDPSLDPWLRRVRAAVGNTSGDLS